MEEFIFTEGNRYMVDNAVGYCTKSSLHSRELEIELDGTVYRIGGHRNNYVSKQKKVKVVGIDDNVKLFIEIN